MTKVRMHLQDIVAVLEDRSGDPIKQQLQYALTTIFGQLESCIISMSTPYFFDVLKDCRLQRLPGWPQGLHPWR